MKLEIVRERDGRFSVWAPLSGESNNEERYTDFMFDSYEEARDFVKEYGNEV